MIPKYPGTTKTPEKHFPSLLSYVDRRPRGQGGLAHARLDHGGRRRRRLCRVERGRLELSEEESPNEGPAVPGLGERQDLRQATHVVSETDKWAMKINPKLKSSRDGTNNE